MILAAFHWWSEGLAAGLSQLAKAVRRPRRFELHAQGGALVLRGTDQGSDPAAILPPDGSPAALPVEVLRRTRGSRIDIVVPAAAILERRLDLPGESRPYVENVVRHQLETLFPWRAADIVHATLTRPREDGRLDVTVRATPRSAIAPALAAASACGASEVVVSATGGTGASADAASIPVAIGAADRDPRRYGRMIARHAITALLIGAVCLPGWAAWVRWSLSADIALLDEAIVDRRAVLKKASEARERAGGGGLEARKRHSVVAVAMLDKLSAILPDDTYLTDLGFDAGRVRITGLSARATELVPLLEGSGHFRSATFSAPVTRMPGRAEDRFSIEAVVVPQGEARP
jgi:general secretion pathway protein L